MIRAGELRHRVLIERRSSTLDAAGRPAATWTEHATRWASIKRNPGNEVLAADQRTGRVPTVFLLRWLSGVLPEMRLTLLGQTPRRFNILSPDDPDGRRKELHITAEELVEEVVP